MRRLMGFGLAVLLGMPGARAMAFSMGEVSAAQGVQSGLAGIGSSPALSALATVKQNLPQPKAATPELTGLGDIATRAPAGGPGARPGAPARSSSSGGNGNGWTNGSKGWGSSRSGSGKGWQVADNRDSHNSKPWATGGGAGKGWQTHGSSGKR